LSGRFLKWVRSSTHGKKAIGISLIIGVVCAIMLFIDVEDFSIYQTQNPLTNNYLKDNPWGPSTLSQMNILGHWDFGQTFDVTAKDKYLYLAAGEQVRIYDISTKEKLLSLQWKQTDIYPIESALGTFKEEIPPGRILHTGGLIEGLFIDGNSLYIANKKHFVIADISDPENSFILSSLDIAGRDIEVRGNYAYIAAPEDKQAGIKIIDISKKTSPKLVRTITLAGYNRPRRVAISGNYLYVAMETDHRLDIIDISDPLNAAFVGNFVSGADSISSYSGVAVRGNYAFVTEYHYGLHVIDISDPSKPVEIAKIIGTANQYNYNDIKLFGEYAFISERYQGFDIIDISNPKSIYIASEVNVLPGYEEGIFPVSLPYGNYTFLSANTMGLGFINIENPLNPLYEGMIATPGGGDSIAVKDNYAYIGSHNEGVWVVNITDKANPKEVALIVNKGRNGGIEIQGNYLYVSGDWSPLSVVDISDPQNPKLLVARFGSNIEGDLVADGDYLYNGNLYYDEGNVTNKVIVFGISNPASPTIVYKGDLGLGPGSFVSAKYRNNYLLGGGQNGLFILDISNKSNPIVAGKYTGLNLYMGSIKVEGNVAYVGSGNELFVFDISDVTKPVKIGSLEVTMPNSIMVYGTIAYTFPRSDRYGFEAVDISDPKNMKILSTLHIGGNDYTGNMDESNGVLYSASGYVIDPGYNIRNASGVNVYSLSTHSRDLNPPNISIIEPRNHANLSGGMQRVNVIITTDERSSCQYSDHDFEYGSGTELATSDGTSHSFDLNISDGNTYKLYHRCMDKTGNKNPESVIQTFIISSFWKDYFTDSNKMENSSGTKLQGGRAILDIPVIKITPDMDVNVYRIMPDDNFNTGSYTDLRIGYFDNYRSYLEFSLPKIEGRIEYIKLFLYRYGSRDAILPAYNNFMTGHTINIYPLRGSFKESQATWNVRNTSLNWTIPGGDYDPTIIDHVDFRGDINGWYSWTLIGTTADNPLDITWGDKVGLLLRSAWAGDPKNQYRVDFFDSKEGSNKPYIEILVDSFSGYLISKSITPTSVGSWDRFNATVIQPPGTNIEFSILDAETNAILCKELSGNGDDVSGCLEGNASVKLKAKLSTSNTSNKPILQEWELRWRV
jgi:hypothetical protein